MTWWVRWDGVTLVVAQRPNGFVYFGVLASWLLFGAALSMGGSWSVYLATFAMAVLVPMLAVAWFRTVRAAASVTVQTLRGARVIPAVEVKALSLRREARNVSSRYGRGQMPFVILTLRTDAGRHEELMVIEDAALDEASWRALRDGLAALPYGAP